MVNNPEGSIRPYGSKPDPEAEATAKVVDDIRYGGPTDPIVSEVMGNAEPGAPAAEQAVLAEPDDSRRPLPEEADWGLPPRVRS